MFRYVELCVELKKGRYAKDGCAWLGHCGLDQTSSITLTWPTACRLIHYRNVCQQVNVSSLEEVIKHFLKTATDKAEDAQSKAEVGALLAGCHSGLFLPAKLLLCSSYLHAGCHDSCGRPGAGRHA